MTLRLQAPPRDTQHGTAITSEGPQRSPAAQENSLLMNPPSTLPDIHQSRPCIQPSPALA